jgi:L-asparagine transporter-like permease
MFFPLVAWFPAGKTIDQVFGVFLGLVAHATRAYWPFVFFSALSRKADFERALNAEGGPNMMMPYANVVRMHVMIFVFAGLQAAGLSAYSLYPVLVLYFFPAGSLAKLAFQRGRRPKQLA